MELARVVISETSDQQVIYLREKDGERTFPIIIGIFEAVSIDRSLERIVVDDLVEEDKRGTFHAKLHISRDGEDIVVDARPSDAIAIAVRVNCPVFVDDSVLDKVASG
jgi:bifunctional DNase/RNase